MVYQPDLITTKEAMHMKYIVINSGWYTMGRDYILNETGESFSILHTQPLGPTHSHKSGNIYFWYSNMTVFCNNAHISVHVQMYIK